ncbi:cysteine-rich CWC family protein [Spirosoma koreense]
MSSTSCKHDQVVCPCCRTVFECKVGSIDLCQCTAVQLTGSQRQYIGERFSGCLCAGCLLALQTEYAINLPKEPVASAPTCA